ncbi:hypothetical protein ACFWUZ_04895 [Streptomyces sp. NPDC058646]|uniref:hypothetical protein n=1 Tax=Streptomyces sp. NPDC058646 TaxID=3346574 RepID=UPI003657AF52
MRERRGLPGAARPAAGRATSHLAPAVVEEMEAAPALFGGTPALVTHDRRLRAADRQPEPASASR